MKPRLADYLDHIRQASAESALFIQGKEKEDFLGNLLLQKAILMNFIIIGEASARIMDRFPEFAASHPEVPWKSIRNMRNQMAHVYFDVDLDLIWDTVKVHLPAMVEKLPRLPVAQEETDPGVGED